MKAEFTDNERTILIGLLALAKRQYAQLEQTRAAIGEFIDEESDTCGRASDAVYGSGPEDPVESADWLIGLCKFDAARESGRQ